MSSDKTLPQDDNQSNTTDATPVSASEPTSESGASAAENSPPVAGTDGSAEPAGGETAASESSAAEIAQSAGERIATAAIDQGSAQEDSAPSSGVEQTASPAPGNTTAEEANAPKPRLQIGAADAATAKAVPSLEPHAKPTAESVGEQPPASQPQTPASTSPLFTQTDTASVGAEDLRQSEAEIAAAQAASMGTAESGASAEAVPSKAAVEIPAADELDPDIEAQISSLMESGAGPQPTPAIIPSGDETAAAAEAQPSEEELARGQRLQAKVQTVSGDDVFLDLGYRSPGVVSLRQFEKGRELNPGTLIEVAFDKFDAEEGLIHVNLPRGRRKVAGNWDAVEKGQVVDCMVTKTNKGGLEITVSNLRGFLPASQVDLRYVSDLEPFVGQKLTCIITDVNPAKRNLIVSRRAFLLEERKELEQQAWEKLAVGQQHSGVVKTIKDYGAFVDLGGVDGFLHIGEMAWNRIRHPSEILSEGQEVDVQILNLDPERKRIGLGMKQLKQNPWEVVEDSYPVGSTVSGKVTRTADFGAFVELEQGVEGMVHISELDYRRVGRVTDVLKEGQTADFKVLEIDKSRSRISLSLKALKEKPPELVAKETPDEDKAPGAGQPYKRKRQGPLKGGYTGPGQASGSKSQPQSGGGFFGNPDDFE